MKNTKDIINYINKIPKSELHLHIEGSLEPELMFKLSKRNKIEIPFKSIEEIKSAYNFSNLDSFLKIYYQGSNVLITEEDFFDLTWEYILRCKKDKIVHTYHPGGEGVKMVISKKVPPTIFMNKIKLIRFTCTTV